MENHIIEFVDFKRGGNLKESSAKDYLRTLNTFKNIVRKPLEAVDRSDIIKYRARLTEIYSPKSVEHAFNILHCFIKFWNPEIKTISHERIEVPKARSNPHATVTKEEHLAMMGVFQDNNYRDLQARLVLQLLWDCGCRIGELLSINLQDLDFDNKRVRIKTEKTKKERVLFWSDETHKTFCKLLPLRWEIKRSDALFLGAYAGGGYSKRVTPRTIQRWFMRAKEGAGLTKNIVPHSYRHSRIQRWINSNLSLIDVTYLSGHENITSLEHYMRLGASEVEEKARRAM